MQRKSPSDKMVDCENHLQSIIRTYKPALEMIISRLICRHPCASKTFLALRNDKKIKQDEKEKKRALESENHRKKKRKETEEMLPIFKGVVDIYVLEGWEQKCALDTVFVITIPHWFAEAVNLLEIMDNPQIEAEFELDNEYVLINVFGTIGISRFLGDFIPFLKEQFRKFEMPQKCGLDTQLIEDARYLQYRYPNA